MRDTPRKQWLRAQRLVKLRGEFDVQLNLIKLLYSLRLKSSTSTFNKLKRAYMDRVVQ